MQFKLARAGVKTFAGVIMSAAVLGGMSANAFAERLIKVATEPTFPPFEFVNTQTGEVSGFEMDLVRAVGKELGAKIEFQVLSFDAIIPAMLSGTVEMGAAGFSITEERKKRVLYSDTFYTSGLSLVTTKAKAGAVKSMKDLEGKTIGVQIGTTSHNAAKKVKGAKIVTFNTAGEAILDLSIGGSDAVINDRPVTAYIMTQQPKLGAQLVHQPETYSADDFAFVFRKDQSALKDEVNAALAKLKSNGEYDKIYNKWFRPLPQGSAPAFSLRRLKVCPVRLDNLDPCL